MAVGKTEREVVQDPNAQRGGNAPSQRLAVQGIMRTPGAPAQTADRGLTAAVDKLGALSETMKRKRANADFLEGRMASASGKTQAEVAETGNRTTMAGFVSVEVSNAVANWSREQTEAAATQHYGTDPAEYQRQLAKSSADLIAAMGGDAFAEETLMKALEPEMQRVTSAQAAQHAAYTETETMNAYTNSLVLSGQYAASAFEGSATDPAGPVGGAMNSKGDFRGVVNQFVDQIIHVESGGNPNAKNPKSSAEGLGQFIDSTWLNMLAKYRPDLAGKSRAEKLALKRNGALSKEMTTAYGAENAAGLQASGLKVSPGTVYLSHFAGLGGARRVLKASPSAPVSSSLTKGQISANKSIMYKNGRLITNAELVAWADRKMGGKKAAAPNVQTAVLTNPGLPPEKHRMAVTQALVSTLSAGDASLWQNVGGMDGLAALNLSLAQTTQIQRAVKGLEAKRQSEYNMDYEREKDDLLKKAQSGEYTADQIFEELGGLQTKYSRSDQENKRTHGLIQQSLDNAGQTEAAGVWAEPDNQYQLFEIQQQVLDGQLTAEEAMQDIVELGAMMGADEVTTSKQVAVILSTAAKLKAEERREVDKAVKVGEKVAKERATVEDMISRSILGTGTPDQQKMGIAVIEQALMEDIAQSGIAPEDMKSKANDMMSKVLVQNDVTDVRRASMMRAAMANPVGPDGKITDNAVEAMAFFMDLKHGANATPEYLTRMFTGNGKTLELMLTAEEHMLGDADIETAIQKAHEQVNNPVTQARVADTVKRLDRGEIQSEVKQAILDQSGLVDTTWNRFMNTFNPEWDKTKLDDKATARIMADSGLDTIIESETRSAMALYPQASAETIATVVTGQMAERGSILGNSFVMAPEGKSIAGIMGLNSKEPNASNEAMTQYVLTHGEELFGPAVWKDVNRHGVAGWIAQGLTMSDEPLVTPEFHVEMVGENLVISPAADKYGELGSIPEASIAVVRAKDVGLWYNAEQTKGGGATNTVIDWLKHTARDVIGGPVVSGEPDPAPLPPVDPTLRDFVSDALSGK